MGGAGSEQTPKRQVRVTIANQSFTLVTSGEDREVLELAHRVDELIAGIASRSSNVDTARLAILACLHLADQLEQAESEVAHFRELVHAKAKHFEGLLDQVIEDSNESASPNHSPDSV